MLTVHLHMTECMYDQCALIGSENHHPPGSTIKLSCLPFHWLNGPTLCQITEGRWQRLILLGVPVFRAVRRTVNQLYIDLMMLLSRFQVTLQTPHNYGHAFTSVVTDHITKQAQRCGRALLHRVPHTHGLKHTHTKQRRRADFHTHHSSTMSSVPSDGERHVALGR